ncbi:hypothetical protein ACWEV4_03580 [Streptomyces sp. NPDC003860]
MTTPPALLIADHGAHEDVGAGSFRVRAATSGPRRSGPPVATGLAAPAPPPPPGALPAQHGARRFTTARATQAPEPRHGHARLTARAVGRGPGRLHGGHRHGGGHAQGNGHLGDHAHAH